MANVTTAPQAPLTANMTTTSVTSSVTATLGSGKGGRYLFAVTGPYVGGTADMQDITVWISFGRGTPTAPVAGTTGYPLVPFTPYEFVLAEGDKFVAISDTTTVNMTWGRIGDE
jgi:hypothetical protein